jgi:hypothetical protein
MYAGCVEVKGVICMSTNPWAIDEGRAPASSLEARVLRRSLSNGAVLLGSIAVKAFAIK